jgi:drug/metabolite transporter (DMT)-like permease
MHQVSATPHPEAAAFRGVVLVLLAGVFWSTGGLLVRLIEAAGVWQILFYRSLSLALFLVLVLWLRNWGALLGAFRAAGVAGLVAGLCLVMAFCGFIFALVHTTVASALFLLSAAPFGAAALGWALLGEAVHRRTWLAMGLAVIGIGIMVSADLDTGRMAGNLAALVAATGFAGFTVALRWGRASDMLPAVCNGATVTAILALLFCLFGEAWGGGQGLAVSLRDFTLSSLMGVAQIGCGMVLYILGSRQVPAAELTLLSLSEVVLGPIWVWLWIGEVASGRSLLGGAIVLLAVAAMALGARRRRRPPVGLV